MNYIKISFAFIFGTIWGSFFYSLALRYTNGLIKENPIKALFSRSECPWCNNRIKPIFLIPIMSYIIQKGKCNNCGNKISLEYPLYEILYGLLLLSIILKHGITIYSINIFLIASIALVITIIDIKTLTIPNSLVIILALLSIYPIILNDSYKDSIYGFLLMFIYFLIILLIFPGSFGGGDVKLASIIGLLFGLERSIVVLITALITGALFGIAYAIITKKGLRTKIPFGPFLTLGMIIAFLYGDDIILIYFKTLY